MFDHASGDQRLQQVNSTRDRGRRNGISQLYYPRVEQLEDRQLLADCVVINANNDGAGSLRKCIIDANNGLFDVIKFAINTGVQVISPTSPLPAIDKALGLIIDGKTQPGYTNSPLIVLNGQFAGTGASAIGLQVLTQGITIRGLSIVQFKQAGVEISGSNAKDNRVLESYIGVDHTGQTKAGNGVGIRIKSGASSNFIGDIPNPFDNCNAVGGQTIISGNGTGVRIEGSSKNVVCNTYIGLAKDGKTAAGNTGTGLIISDSTENTIGGNALTDPDGIIFFPANVISSNSSNGITILDSTKTYVKGNFIGTNSAGNQGKGNGWNGIYIDDSSDNIIGSLAVAGERNVISGNGLNAIATDKHGVYIRGIAGLAVRNQIVGNYIGTPKNGDQINTIGNQGAAIRFGVGVAKNQNRVIGNVYGGNLQGGVVLAPNAGTGITISANSSYRNVGSGIDLGADGQTPNDANDGDEGPNRLQNYPFLISAWQSSTGGGGLSVEWTLYFGVAGFYVLEFFDNPECDSDVPEFGEGKTYLGGQAFNMDPSMFPFGEYSGEFLTPNVDPPPEPPFYYGSITATATDPDGNTSEFSNCIAAEIEGGSMLNGMSPNSGPVLGGNVVTILGNNFLGTRRVVFGDTPAQFRVVSRTRLVAIAPSSVARTVNVTVANPRGTSPVVPAGRYTYIGGAGPGGGRMPFAELFQEAVGLSGFPVPLLQGEKPQPLPPVPTDMKPTAPAPPYEIASAGSPDWLSPWLGSRPGDSPQGFPPASRLVPTAKPAPPTDAPDDIWAGVLALDESWWFHALALGPVLGERYHSLTNP